MGSSPRAATSRRRRDPLTRTRILEAALRFIDERGADELSMRRLAKTLDTEAMALYRHVDDKDDLLVGVIDRLLATLEFPDESLDWKSWIRELFVRLHRLYADHPNLAPIVAQYSGRGVERPRIFERSIEVLQRAGFDQQDVHHVLHLISSHLLGSVLIGLRRTDYVKEYDGPPRDDGPFPLLRAYVPVYQACDRQVEFELGLDLILQAFEARLSAPAGESDSSASLTHPDRLLLDSETSRTSAQP